MAKVGTQGWLDLTVDDAGTLRDFYAEVAGWTPEALDMGGYSDFVMKGPDGTAVAGVCHRRGENGKLPPVWIPYFVVADLERAVSTAEGRGATIIDRRSKMCVLRDPAGASFALWQGEEG